jgi:hypothetical protein
MNAERENVRRRSVAGRDGAREKWLRALLGLVLAAAFALPGAAPWRRVPSCRRFQSGESRRGRSPLKNRNGRSGSTPTTRRQPARSRLRRRPIRGPTCGRRPLPRGRNLPPPRKTLQRRRTNNRRNNRNSRQVASRGCRVIVGFAGDPFREPCIVVRLRGHRIVARIRGPHVVVRFRGRGEMVDARDLKSLGGNPVRVRVPPSAPIRLRHSCLLRGLQ